MSADPTTTITELGVEPTYSAREATAFFPRSYSWFDQRLREGQFVLPDGTTVPALRTPGGYRRFTLAMLRDIAVICTNQGWFSLDELKFTLRELLIVAHQQTGEYKIPELTPRPAPSVQRDRGGGLRRPRDLPARGQGRAAPDQDRPTDQGVHLAAERLRSWRR